MNVQYNNDNITTEAKNLEELLDQYNLLSKNGIAVALNNSVVPKDQWGSKELNENDNILVITATQGG